MTLGVFPDDVDGNPPLYDVKDLAVSYDGLQLAFAMRAPMDPDLDALTFVLSEYFDVRVAETRGDAIAVVRKLTAPPPIAPSCS